MSNRTLEAETRLYKTHREMFLQDLVDNVTHNKHMYVTVGQACPCGCLFCRNAQFKSELKIQNPERLIKVIKEYDQYFRTITIGGGEPLLYLDLLRLLGPYLRLKSGRPNIITCGLRDKFLENEELIYLNFRKIYLTRLKANDEENQLAFNTNTAILSASDIMGLKKELRRDIEFAVTCFKNGGVDSSEELLEFVEWASSLGISKLLFNDLQRDVTALEFWEKRQIEDVVFEESISELKRRGFTQISEIVFSGGYTISSFEGDYYAANSQQKMNIGFKKYHYDISETKDLWQTAKTRAQDFSLMPNGDLFSDWTNRTHVPHSF